ncbi:MAG: hypothetical protein IT355_20520 [Gemmatimonadaceae bacterium]|nr:hypothetical protein [Gemmatimonadaceae bacterium]
MTAPAPSRRDDSPDPPALHDRAIQDLSFIRKTIEGASAFTDVPGWGLVAIGLTAIATAALARAQRTAGGWITTWLGEALLAGCLGGAMMWRKMQRRGVKPGAPLLSAPARKFLIGFWPAIIAGAVLTVSLVDMRLVWQPDSTVPRVLPGMWLLLYGVGITTAGAFSIRAVPLMGATFMTLGSLTLIVPSISGDLMLALGFGALQIGFGAWIARRHGG